MNKKACIGLQAFLFKCMHRHETEIIQLGKITMKQLFLEIKNLSIIIVVILLGFSSNASNAQSFTQPNGIHAISTFRIEALVDLNGDGIQDTTDRAPLPFGTGISVTIKLNNIFYSVINLGNNILSQELLNLPLGTYTLSVDSIPSGWIGSTAMTVNKTVSVALSNDTIQFMFFKKITVGGIIYNDLNANGLFDSGEPGLSNWNINLNTTGVLTDNSGYYSFGDVTPGTYTLIQSPHAGWTSTSPASGSYNFTALSGVNISDGNFGNSQLSKLVIITSIDNNGDGVFTSSETTPLPSNTLFTFSLMKDLLPPINYTVGDNILTTYIPNLDSGQYTFTPLSIPSGWSYTSPANFTRNLSWGMVDTVHLLLFKNVSILGKVYEDVNANGNNDVGEPNLSGWKVTLNPFGSTMTDSTGTYVFSNIGPGTFNVAESLYAGWIKISPSNPNYVLTTLSGNNIANLDFGNFKLGQFRVEVSIDQNGNGITETTDHSPLPAGTTASLTVNKDGSGETPFTLGNNTLSAQFDNLSIGTYTFNTTSLPPSWILTTLPSITRIISTSGSIDTIRFLLFKLINVGGTVFEDLDANGIFDSSESRLPGWILSLDNNRFDTSDINGLFFISNIGPGNHVVTEVQKNGWGLSTPRSPSITINPTSGINIGSLKFGNYQVGSISGMKFNDLNKNGIKDATEPGLAGWKIVAQQIRTIGNVSTTSTPETTTTSAAGYYTFGNLLKGIYSVSELSQPAWVQTYPSGDGKYIVTIDSGLFQTNIDFGNALGFSYIGVPGGLWSNPSNWEGNRVPTDTDAVYLGANTNVVYDLPSTTTIGSLRLDSGATLIIDSTAGQLYIHGRLEITEHSSLTFFNSNSLGKLYCDGDFVINGVFNPGHSAVYITGDSSIIIMNGVPASSSSSLKGIRSINAQNPNHFFNLNISGTNDSTGSNIIIDNQLILQQSLFLRQQDTVFINNPEHDAITQNGSLPAGTVSRQIKSGSIEQYRFESTNSFVQFDGTSGMPTALSITTMPSSLPDTTSLLWKVIPSTVDTSTNTIRATGLNHFSKWVAGKPGSGLRKGSVSATEQYLNPSITRTYVIKAEGGDQFNATLQLRYENSEVIGNESDLSLGRGAYYVDTVSMKWNMVSLPVVTDNGTKDSIFINSSSNAFLFNGSYTVANTLTFGTGYWLKFPASQTVSILGNDQSSGYFRVEQGWNMIGMISYPIDPATTILYADGGSQTTLTSTSYFGYKNGYQIADMLHPLRAYWVKANEAGYIYMDKSIAIAKRSLLQNLLNGINSLKIRDGAGDQQILYFGFNSSINSKSFEMPPSPPQGILDARFASGTMIENVDKDGSKIIPLNISSGTLPYTISWNMKQTEGTSSLLVDGKEMVMTGTKSVTITNSDIHISLKLSNSISSELPTSFALYQNYPNPFNPTTTISFDLPVDGAISLKIYNVLGQEVLTALNNSDFTAGHYTYTLNTSTLASGIYFYKLQAGLFTDIKKMVLTR